MWLNGLVQNVPYPLHHFFDIMTGLYGSQYFGTFDQADLYHQWCMAPEHIGKIAFRWNSVYYEFIQVCFGIKTMMTLFQHAMSEIMEGIPGLKMYVDDEKDSSFVSHVCHVLCYILTTNQNAVTFFFVLFLFSVSDIYCFVLSILWRFTSSQYMVSIHNSFSYSYPYLLSYSTSMPQIQLISADQFSDSYQHPDIS